MALVRVSGPEGVEALWGLVLRNINLDGSAENDVFTKAAFNAALQMIDGPTGMIGRAILPQTWDLLLDGCDARGRRPIRVPLPPLQEVLSVKYLDRTETEQTLATGAYQVVQGTPATIVPAAGMVWPETSSQPASVRIRFTAGYTSDVTDPYFGIPSSLVAAICLQTRHLNSITSRNLFLRVDKIEGVGEQQFIVSDAAGKVVSAAVDSLLQRFKVYG